MEMRSGQDRGPADPLCLSHERVQSITTSRKAGHRALTYSHLTITTPLALVSPSTAPTIPLFSRTLPVPLPFGHSMISFQLRPTGVQIALAKRSSPDSVFAQQPTGLIC